MKCNRYVFSYISTPEEVREYILRLADSAIKTYGRDIYFSRFHQMLDNARCLGWDIPRFSNGYIPEPFQDLTEEAIDYIFENQAKILIDVSPITEVALEDFDVSYPVRMIGATTPAGDLVWKTHLLINEDSGQPFIVVDGKNYSVKTKGTKLVCSYETIPYDGKILEAYFGGKKGVWPVPFLPEVFSDHPLASVFTGDNSVVETVFIDEKEPVKVLANRKLPWYRPLEINHNKALVMKKPQLEKSYVLENEEADESDEEEDDGLQNEEEIKYTNVIVKLTSDETTTLQNLETYLKNSGIANRKEAENLQEEPSRQEQAKQWLANNWKRKTLLANSSNRIGSVLDIISKYPKQPIVVVHPRDKWAIRLAEMLKSKNFPLELVTDEELELLEEDATEEFDNKIYRFIDQETQIIVTSNIQPEFFIDDAIIILVSSLSRDKEWFEVLNSTHHVYAISLDYPGFEDCNLIKEDPNLIIDSIDYDGPSVTLFKGLDVVEKIKSEVKEVSAEKSTEETSEVEQVASPESVENTEEKVSETPEVIKKPKVKKEFRVVTGKGRPMKAATMEDARVIATKKESEGCRVQIFNGKNEVVYITSVGEVT